MTVGRHLAQCPVKKIPANLLVPLCFRKLSPRSFPSCWRSRRQQPIASLPLPANWPARQTATIGDHACLLASASDNLWLSANSVCGSAMAGRHAWSPTVMRRFARGGGPPSGQRWSASPGRRGGCPPRRPGPSFPTNAKDCNDVSLLRQMSYVFGSCNLFRSVLLRKVSAISSDFFRFLSPVSFSGPQAL